MDTVVTTSRDNIQVVVRIRPPNEEESRDQYHPVTQAVNDKVLVFDPKVHRSIGFLPRKPNEVNRRRFKDLKYGFDYVFGPTTKNEEVFKQTMKCIVQGVIEGYNCSVFAYGATGAGKTHTMLGNEMEPGVIYYTMIDLYEKINDHKPEKNFDVSVSYSEVYNEQVRDLLIPHGNLPIREDKKVGVIITGLSLHKPKTAEELLRMLKYGNQNRTQHPTDANAESSRSHAVFQVFVSQRYNVARVNSELKMAKMCLVDLAGSERAHATTNHGLRFREGANINRSLLALGNVINALADSKFKGHIPYRESKLTRLLKDSLGGNCRTVMIAAVSPSSKSYDDTYNTLRYADRAKHIRANLKQNVVNVDLHISDFKKHVEHLERENQDLREIKLSLEKRLEQKSAPYLCKSTLNDLDKRMVKLFKTRKEIRKSQMASDGVVRELLWKVSRKEKTIRRVQNLTQSLHVLGKHSRVIDRMKQRIEKEETIFESALQRLKHQEDLIQSTYLNAVASLKSDDQPLLELEQSVRLHSAEAALHDTTACLAFVKKMARAQEKQSTINERLIKSLIMLSKRQYDILNSQAPNLLQGDIKKLYEECCYLVEDREVLGAQKEDYKDEESFEDLSINDIIDIKVPHLILADPRITKQNQISTASSSRLCLEDGKQCLLSRADERSSLPNKIIVGDKPTQIKQMNLKQNNSSVNTIFKITSKSKPTNAVKPATRPLFIRTSKNSRIIPEFREAVSRSQPDSNNRAVVNTLSYNSQITQSHMKKNPIVTNQSPAVNVTRSISPPKIDNMVNVTNQSSKRTTNLTGAGNTVNIAFSDKTKSVEYTTSTDKKLTLENSKVEISTEPTQEGEGSTSETKSHNDTFEMKKATLANTPMVDSLTGGENSGETIMGLKNESNTIFVTNNSKPTSGDTNEDKNLKITTQKPTLVSHNKKSIQQDGIRRISIPSVFLNSDTKGATQVKPLKRNETFEIKTTPLKRNETFEIKTVSKQLHKDGGTPDSFQYKPCSKSPSSSQSKSNSPKSSKSKCFNFGHKIRKLSPVLKSPKTRNIKLSSESIKSKDIIRKNRPSPAPRVLKNVKPPASNAINISENTLGKQ